MNAVAKIEAVKPFDAYAAYRRERAYSRRLEDTLSRAVALLRMETNRRELRGEDVAHLRTFIADTAEVGL